MAESVQRRRRFPRLRKESPVHVRKLGADFREECAKTTTLSLGGCMFVAREPVGADTFVDLLISVRPQQVIEARGKVVYEQAQVSGFYEVGVEFTSISEPDRRALMGLFEDHIPDLSRS